MNNWRDGHVNLQYKADLYGELRAMGDVTIRLSNTEEKFAKRWTGGGGEQWVSIDYFIKCTDLHGQRLRFMPGQQMIPFSAPIFLNRDSAIRLDVIFETSEGKF